MATFTLHDYIERGIERETVVLNWDGQIGDGVGMMSREMLGFILFNPTYRARPSHRRIMSISPPESDLTKPKLHWYQHMWLWIPIGLVAVGGAIGGTCGGIAWATNYKVFRKTEHSVLRYVFTGLISVAAVVAYLIFSSLFIFLVHLLWK